LVRKRDVDPSHARPSTVVGRADREQRPHGRGGLAAGPVRRRGRGSVVSRHSVLSMILSRRSGPGSPLSTNGCPDPKPHNARANPTTINPDDFLGKPLPAVPFRFRALARLAEAPSTVTLQPFHVATGQRVVPLPPAVLIPTERKSAKDFDLRDSLHTCEQTSRHTRALASGYPVVVLPRGRLLGTKECHESVVRML